MRAIYPDQVTRMNAHVVVFAESQILRRASLLELRNARRLLLRQGKTQAAQVMWNEITRRIGHASS